MFGFDEDTEAAFDRTLDFVMRARLEIAYFSILTPYPGTPLWKQMAPRVSETDWQKFDGFTPVFNHPSLTGAEMRFLLGAAYTRFYMRPSWLAHYLGISSSRVRQWVSRLDDRVSARHAREEIALMSRAVGSL